MTKWSIDYYTTPEGFCPVEVYLRTIPAEQAAQVLRKIDLLEALGTGLREPHARHLDGKLWELRVTGRNAHRVIYFTVHGGRFVLLHAFLKTTEKTPGRELSIAESRMTEYLGRMSRGAT